MFDEYTDKIKRVQETIELLQQQANSLAEHIPVDDVIQRVHELQAQELPLSMALRHLSTYDLLMFKAYKSS